MPRPNIEAIAARLAATTPGPWRTGGYYSLYHTNEGALPDGTMLHTFPLGRCYYCKDKPEPCERQTLVGGKIGHAIWLDLEELTKRSDQRRTERNTERLAQAKEKGEDPEDVEQEELQAGNRGWHYISSAATFTPITGNFDYDEGGVSSKPEDSVFITNAPTDVEELLAYVTELERRAKRDDTKEVERLRDEVTKLRQSLDFQRQNNESRNRQLDALHFVWCNGGCQLGVHRYGEHPPLTDEIVTEAIRNTNRLISWHNNHKFKQLPLRERFDHIEASRLRWLEAAQKTKEACAEVCRQFDHDGCAEAVLAVPVVPPNESDTDLDLLQTMIDKERERRRVKRQGT